MSAYYVVNSFKLTNFLILMILTLFVHTAQFQLLQAVMR